MLQPLSAGGRDLLYRIHVFCRHFNLASPMLIPGSLVEISLKTCMFFEILRVVKWMLDERPQLAYFMGWLLPLNLVLSTNFGRLAQRQSIGLTLRPKGAWQVLENTA